MTSGNAKCRDWLVQPISVYRRMRIRPAAKSYLLRVLHMRSGYKFHSGIAGNRVELFSVSRAAGCDRSWYLLRVALTMYVRVASIATF